MDKLNHELFQAEHHLRNLGLLSVEDHKKIGEATLLIAGCGVGSQIALSAVRIGFEKFILVDGDTVELSNNNRQGYSWRDVGKKKVDALARKIKAINPHCHIRKYPIFITPENAAHIVKKADIIIDAIDPEAATAEFAIHREARKNGKFVIQPADLGWGGGIYVFSNKSVHFEEMLGYSAHTKLSAIDPEEAYLKIVDLYLKAIPVYAQKVAADLMSGKLDHAPQSISGSYILSAISVIAAKRIALGLPIKLAPNFISFDPYTVLDPNEK